MKMSEKSLLQSAHDNEANFIHFIHHRLGIVIPPHQKNELNKLILKACQNFSCSPTEYLETLKNSSDKDSPELEHLIQGVTIGETYFFRDKRQMDLLTNKLLPELINKKRQKNDLTLRIWSAGCATGEEIYTIYMLLNELIVDIASWRIQLLGTDINASAMKQALLGQYGEWSMRSISTYYKERYFKVISHQPNRYEIHSKVRSAVHFTYLNLSENTYPSILNETNAQDLIICRNVLIYFNMENIPAIMQRLSHCLAPDGYLLLGASDPVVIKETPLVFHHQDGMLFSNVITDMKPAEITKAITAVKMHISKPTKPKAEKPQKQDYESQINTLILDSSWDKALELLDKAEPTLPLHYFIDVKATVLAGLGKLDQAVKLCESGLNQGKPNKFLYFTYANILNELKRFEEAEAALRKTLFLDRLFALGHFQLGLLQIRQKKIEAGRRSLNNALNLIESKNPNQIVEGSTTLTNAELKEILTQELVLHPGVKGGKHAKA